MRSGEERGGVDGERMRSGSRADGKLLRKKLLFLDIFLRYFGEWEGAEEERMRSGGAEGGAV